MSDLLLQAPMADFRTHLTVAGGVSAMAALGSYALGWHNPEQTLLCFAMGVVGGLLPDLDSDHSRPLRLFFTLASVLAAFSACFVLSHRVGMAELVLVWFGVYLLVRYAVFEVFTRLTVHRGSFHSLLATALSGAGTALAAHTLGAGPIAAWTLGAFMAMGYLTHLVLDELYSVNLLGVRLKASFGTALKPVSLAYPCASVAMAAALAAAWWYGPPLEPVTDHWQRLVSELGQHDSLPGLLSRLRAP